MGAGKELCDSLTYKKKNVFESSNANTMGEIYGFAEDYKKFLDLSKTEREATEQAIELARAAGYREYLFGDAIRPGEKYYLNNRGKSVILFRVGTADPGVRGVRILASHIDSPRLDLKQVPLYQDGEMAFFKTHYYGGIKKYQWTTIPLALHGVISRADGGTVRVNIGEDSTDPVFYINDLLPHLASKQGTEPLSKAIGGEDLNVLAGALPYDDEEVKEKIKLTVLSLLNEKYGVTEEDFLTAEISAVPAFGARDIGFDRALIGAYGHDDRVCAYPALRALLACENEVDTSIVVLADKEEIGSVGNTGMQSDVLCDVICAIAKAFGADPICVRAASSCISADVTAAYDPNFAGVYEKQNSSLLSFGVAMSKYTGAGGKSGTSDASAEFIGSLRKLFSESGVIWQTAELGKVDAGGGGTVAKFIANHNIDTVDMGVPVISMHAPYEVISKGDLYSAYTAFLAFLNHA